MESLTKPEWMLMEALWARSPLFLSELMEATADAVHWNRSSYLTYLKRMTDRGLIAYKTISGNRCYSPLVRREDCIERERASLIAKLTESNARLLLVSMIEKSELSREDQAELGNLIAKLSQSHTKER